MTGTVAAKPKPKGAGASLAEGLMGLLRTPEAPVEEPGMAALVAALAEPAAVVSTEGRVLQANAAWRTAMGRAARLAGGSSLYTAFAAARRSGRSEGRLSVAGGERTAQISLLNDRLFLVRLAEAAAAPQPTATPGNRRGDGRRAADKGEAPKATPGTMDVLAAASPFGAASVTAGGI